MTAIEKLERRKVGLEVMKTENFIALIWNANKICDSENCPIYSRCESCNPGDICFPHKTYLEQIYSAALDMLGVSLDTRQAVRLGLHVIPLYSMLFELKLAAAGIKSVWEHYGKSQDLRVNPIFREVREQTKLIDDMWSKLGYKQLVGHGSSLEGDSAYCDNMFVEN